MKINTLRIGFEGVSDSEFVLMASNLDTAQAILENEFPTHSPIQLRSFLELSPKEEYNVDDMFIVNDEVECGNDGIKDLIVARIMLRVTIDNDSVEYNYYTSGIDSKSIENRVLDWVSDTLESKFNINSDRIIAASKDYGTTKDIYYVDQSFHIDAKGNLLQNCEGSYALIEYIEDRDRKNIDVLYKVPKLY